MPFEPKPEPSTRATRLESTQLRHLVGAFPGLPTPIALASLPTPVQRAPWADAGRCTVWVKRDDEASALYGGGKVRKLEWLLGAIGHGPRPLVSVGACGSHHLLALAAHAPSIGREVHAVVFGRPRRPACVSSLERLGRHAASIHYARWRIDLPLVAGWHALRVGAILIPAGGSSAIGCLGFVEAGLELAAQIAVGAAPRPDVIYIAAGTAGAAAGLKTGLDMAGVDTELRLVSAVERAAFNQVVFWNKLRQLRRVFPLPRRVRVRWSIDHDQVGRGYPVATRASVTATHIAREHGLELEPIYTGKCLSALRCDAATGKLENKTVLFWNTHAGHCSL